MKQIYVIGLVVITLLTSGCDSIYGERGLIHNRTNNYLKSESSRKLIVPTSLSKDKISHHYTIQPVRGYTAPSLLPPGSLVEKMGYEPNAIVQPGMPASTFVLKTQQADPLLIVNRPLPQAWGIVQAGLKRQRIPMTDHDMKQKRYTILDTYPTAYKITSATPMYRIQMKAQDGKTQIRVTSTKGETINAARAKRLLASLDKGMQGYSRRRTLTELVGSYTSRSRS